MGWSGTQYVRSKDEPVATPQSIGTAAFAWKSGWSFMDRLPRRARSSVPQRPLARWHGQRTLDPIAAWVLRTTQFASGVEPTIANSRVQIGRYTDTGKANGIRIHRRSEPMYTTCCSSELLRPLDASGRGGVPDWRLSVSARAEVIVGRAWMEAHGIVRATGSWASHTRVAGWVCRT